LLSSERASASVSSASSMMPSPSRSHCTAAPAMNTEPSSAYARSPRGPHAEVVSIPWRLGTRFSPVCTSRKAPVP
jgi:hypothetical protein